MKRIIIAIDGSSGCGKSSTARAVAKELGYTYVDSGAMYRAVTLFFLDNNISLDDTLAVENALRQIEISFRIGTQGQSETWLNGRNCEQEIRAMRVARFVSKVSALPAVRKSMVARQREMGKSRGVVMDGRDIGTVVYPDAELKIFLSANLTVRAQRRAQEMADKGMAADLTQIMENLRERDLADSTRAESPLKKAEEAIEINTSGMLFTQQVAKVVELARARSQMS